jgi:hypothetical protein
LGEQAQQLYDQLREKIETPENIGKLIVMEVGTGDYEIDHKGIGASLRLQARHPQSRLYALRIGYKSAVSFCGVLERRNPYGDVRLLACEGLLLECSTLP